jgi:hypothetical protein
MKCFQRWTKAYRRALPHGEQTFEELRKVDSRVRLKCTPESRARANDTNAHWRGFARVT